MNRHSIIAKITIFFAIFSVAVLIIAGWIFSANVFSDRLAFFDRIRHSNIIEELNSSKTDKIYVDELLATILPDSETSKILTTKTPNPPFPPFGPMPRPKHDKDRRADQNFNRPPFAEQRVGFRPNRDNMKIYDSIFERVIIVNVNGKNLGFVDSAPMGAFYLYFWIAVFAVFVGITLLYLAIVKSLTPLKKLQEDIVNFGISKKFVRTQTDYRKDEIGKIRRVFDETAEKISAMVDAREIFLKNAAHELKTPIAKGVVIAHILQDEKWGARLLEIFSRMNEIVNGIMTAETVIADGFAPKLEPIAMRSFCLKIVKKLFLEDEKMVVLIPPDSFAMGDEKLLEIAITNLFDNAVKFSSDQKAYCGTENGKIFVKNRGTPLEEPIDRYFEPFFKETSIRNETGMGLGLYLTKRVLEIQGFKLTYSYHNGSNIFTIG